MTEEEKVVAFVPMRLSSSRLPRKHLREIGDKILLAWVFDRLRSVPEINQIVLCVPDEQDTVNASAEIVNRENVDLFIYRGCTNDVVGRLTSAARYYSATICVLASGDCPLIASDTLSRMVLALTTQPDAGWVDLETSSGRVPIHEGIMVARIAVWDHADAVSRTPEMRAHQFPIIGLEPALFTDFKRVTCQDHVAYDVPSHRLSVDTYIDLEFMRQVHGVLAKRNERFDLLHVVQLLTEQPSLREVNSHVYRRGIQENDREIVFVVTTGSQYGYGNLLRSLEIADAFVENWGLPSRFLVTDRSAVTVCDERGYVAVAESIDKLGEIFESRTGDVVVFDLNSHVELTQENINTARRNGRRVVVIDNLCHAALAADIVIIPTAHHIGVTLPNLLTGTRYVVIRRAVRRLRRPGTAKQDYALVYSSRASRDAVQFAVSEMEQRDPSVRIVFVDEFRSDFCELLAGAKYVISPLSQTSYEAAFMGAQPIVVLTPEEDIATQKFICNIEELKLSDGNGACRIASAVMAL